jgi:hypothetical protein
MKIILEIKFTHRKVKGWVINLPFDIFEWNIQDLIKVVDLIDECFEDMNNPTSIIKKNLFQFMFNRDLYLETWRVYLEDS